MFGYSMLIDLDGLKVILRQPEQSEIESLAKSFSSMIVQYYTNGIAAKTVKDEAEWWEKSRLSTDTVIWAIAPEKGEKIIGVTGLHKIHPSWGSCTSGIIVADPDYWGKGYAYRAHLARTLYAVNTLNRTTIQSRVRVPNVASLKALLKVGYRISGREDRDFYRGGVYMDSYVLSWVNPRRIAELYPEGVPEELTESQTKARAALDLAEKSVKDL
jgi:diamine N-acetyltransferase